MTDNVPILQGDRVRLRPFHTTDIAARLALGRAPEIVRSFGGTPEGLPPYEHKEAAAWVARNMAHPHAWAVEVNTRFLGEVRLDNLNLADRRARLAIGLYDVAQLGHGIGREAIALVLAHAFQTLALHRVDLRVIATNERAIRCYRACGFVEEGRERESVSIGGTWHDDVIMGLLAHEYRAGAQ